MAAFKIPTFEERAVAAREAKQRALDKLRAKSAAVQQADTGQADAAPAAPKARDVAAAERRAAHKATIEQEKEARQQQRAQALADAEAAAERAAALRRPAPPPNLPSAAELKAARDARYAARKARGRG